MTPGLPTAFLDALSDAVLVLDGAGRIKFANTAALRLLPCEPGTLLRQLAQQLDAALIDAVHEVLAGRRGAGELPMGAAASQPPSLQPLDGRLWALRLPPPQRSSLPHGVAALPAAVAMTAEWEQVYRMFWTSAFPVTLQDEAYRYVEVNDAYVEFSGFPRERLIGLDPVLLQPEEDRATVLADRARFLQGGGIGELPQMVERRITDAGGRERWYRAARRVLVGAKGERFYLAVLQDCTSEHVAREQADRSVHELEHWFELSPTGMVMFDDSGLVVRTNTAFEALVGDVPVLLSEASAAVQQLLGWRTGEGEGSGLLTSLQPGDAPVESQGWVPDPDGGMRRLRGLLRCYEERGGRRRYMCVVEDLSAEEERDLAKLQLGTLVDTAGVGLATFQESGMGPRRSRPAAAGMCDEQGGNAAEGATPSLQAIGRDVVLPESLAEFERVQQAVKRGERAEARYAIRHPDHGTRWLFTRVEPGQLASGQRTTSVVTLDVTEQEQARSRSEQLLRELSTILESSPAGIAYLRGNTLVRCNRRFERMLGFSTGAIAGSSIGELFGRHPAGRRVVEESEAALGESGVYETEIEVTLRGRPAQWYALSVRRMAPVGGASEAIAVLSDVTRLKTQQQELEELAQAVAQQAHRTRAILDSVFVGIVNVGAGGIEWMNRSARRMFGGDLPDFIGEPIATAATPEEGHPFHQTQLLEELPEGQAHNFECRMRGRDGREFWVVGNAVATRSDTGARQLTYALLDISRRRQAEARIAEAQASLQRIIEMAPLAITLRDAKTLRVLQINKIAAAVTGHAQQDVVGKAPEELYESEAARHLRADMEAALSSSEVTQREYRRMQDGRMQHWDARYLPLARPGEAPDQLLLVATDVTEQRAAQQARLEAAIAQREMLVKEVHHRIKNNLQGVAGLLQQIASKKPEVAPAIAEVVGQVQAIAQVYGLQVGTGGPLPLRSVVEAIAASVQRTFGRSIALSMAGEATTDWGLPEAESIPIALTLNELLTNAIKHSPAASEIGCAFTTGDGGVQIEVSNAGRLPEGFSLDRFPGGVSGIGLIRALLPRRSATLALGQRADRVVASVSLVQPGVKKITPAP